MNFVEFEHFIEQRTVYETVYNDTEGRKILVIGMSEMYAAVQKLIAEEREACAKVCEQDGSQAGEWTPGARPGGYFAKAIRARNPQ